MSRIQSSFSTPLAQSERDGGTDRSSLVALNKKFLANFQADCTKALQGNAEVDLGPIFKNYSLRYSRLRNVREMRQTQDIQGPPSLSHSSTSNRFEPLTHPTSVVITHPLHPKLKSIIENEKLREYPLAEYSDEQILISKINALVERGKNLYGSSGRTVTQIHTDIVVKSGKGLDLTELTIMEHIHQVSKSFPLPQPLGSVTYDGFTYIFMSFINGTSLHELWPSLSADQKMAVRNQLDELLLTLRNLPLLSPQLGGGVPPRCKDTRRSVRYSSTPIHNEAEFNGFLLSTIKPRIAQTYKEFIQTKCLHPHHRIVMTHGDFHPRNILVELYQEQVKIKGILDWEAGGSYPEYWEYVKSLNTMSSIDEDDWYHYLPVIGMGEYYNEWAADMVLETLII